jgi:peptide deformylase
MALLPILVLGDKRLREKADPVTEVGDAERQLIDDMVETMHDAPGIGLAAPQVGVSKRIVVIDLSAGEGDGKGEVLALVNPEISCPEGEQVGQEGCLSVPEEFADVKRPLRLRLKALDRDGKPLKMAATDLLARVICHEVDHLDGIMFVDHLSSLKRSLIARRIRKLTAREEQSA